MAYDPVNRVKAIMDARGYLTTFQYDGVGNRLAVNTANGGTTAFTYEKRNLLQSTIPPASLPVTNTYDHQVGRLTQRVDGRGVVVTYIYDAINHLVGKHYPDSSLVTYGYDLAGKPINFQDSTGTTRFTYDNDNRVTAVSYPSGNRLTYTYDASGNRRNMLDQNSGLTTWTYDPVNEVSSIVSPQHGITTISRFGWFDAITTLTYANGMQMSRSLVPGCQSETELNRTFLTSAGGGIASYTLTYDGVYNKKSVLELDGTAVTYTYDPVYQLTGEYRTGTNNYTATYAYDSLGNAFQSTLNSALSTFTYNPQNQILTYPGGGGTLVYDANGNMLGDYSGLNNVSQYTFDFENRLNNISYPGSGSSVTFIHSDDGKRQIKNEGSGVIWTNTWDGDNLLYETNGTQSAQYTQLPGKWGQLVSAYEAGSSYFYISDAQDNVRLILNSSEAAVAEFLSTTFGTPLVTSSSLPFNSFMFGGNVGYYADGGTGYQSVDSYHVRNRQYRPDLFKWASLDKLWFNGGLWNLYGYVGNRAVNLTDPSGSGAPQNGKQACIDQVRKINLKLENKISDISDALCSGVFACYATQSCFDRIGWDCDVDAAGAGDTPQVTHACCVRCGNCVDLYWETPLYQSLSVWLKLAEADCRLGKTPPAPPTVQNPCNWGPVLPVSPLWPWPWFGAHFGLGSIYS